MDAKLIYWTGALINLGVVVWLAAAGVRRIRAQDLPGHRRRMVASSGLVGGFVVSYLIKVILLGKENLKVWDSQSLTILYLHETCIALMLIGGGYAGWRAWRFRSRLPSTGPLEDRLSPEMGRRHHRYAGWLALCTGAAALTSAFLVLYGMFTRG